MKKIIVSSMNKNQISGVVDVHLEAFPGFFLSFLGKQFLKEFYIGVIEDPSGIARVVADGQALIGFVAGITQPSGFYRRLLMKRWWRFGLAAIPAVIKKPAIIPRLFRAFSRPATPLPCENCGTLMSIAVRPQAEGGGVGRKLGEAFLFEAQKRGLSAVNLTTDALDNDRVNRFYQRLGFEKFRTFTTPEGRLMNEYVFYFQPIKTE